MNKHIELVKKWLADPDSVTHEELKQNSDEADAVAANGAYEADAAYWAANAAYAAAEAAAEADAAAYAAAYWVERYETLEKDDG